MPFISVIIPVYKVERYLKQCLDSILNQTFKDIEIILIDDESPDNSPEICDMYKNADNRIRVIHKANEGVSVARNTGLELARGEYVIFVDSDDYWNNKNDLVEIVKELELEPDIVLYRSAKYYQNYEKLVMPTFEYDKEKFNSYDKAETLNYISKQGIFPGGAWDKIVRREFLIKNNIYFDSNLVSSEDIDWVFSILVASKNIKLSNTIMYIYRQQRLESVTNNIKEKNIRDLFFTIKKWSENLSNTNDEVSNALFHFLAYEYSILIALLPNIKKDIVKEFKTKIEKYDWLLGYNLNPKVKKVKIAYNILGFYGTEKMLSFMIWRKDKRFFSK